MEPRSNGAVTTEELERTPAGVVKRWVAEIDRASGREKDWREAATKVYDRYRGKQRGKNSYNILFANTETLRPAIYNSTPKPDVRRRYTEQDIVAKFASTILQRSLAYEVEYCELDFVMKKVTLDTLLPGRGLARIEYKPVFQAVPADTEEEDFIGEEPTGEEPAEVDEEVVEENAAYRHVKWPDFRYGPADSWDEIPWVAFRHCLPYDELVRMFGEAIASKIPLGDEKSNNEDKEIRGALKTGEFWEIWDKSQKRVLFIAPKYKNKPLRVESDPLRLSKFFPIPEPVYAIEDTESLVPVIPYHQYEEQAEELNTITQRINKVTQALKVRGLYASHIGEIQKVIQATDNEMLPIENASLIAEMGGLDKAIWIMPIERLVMVVKELYAARAQCVQTIYELSDVGDVIRGVSNPHETLGAQKIKSQWGSLRLQRVQRDVQRFVRDLLRMQAEIMSEHFSSETLAAMSGIQLPTNEVKQQIQSALAQVQPQQQSAPPAQSSAQPGQGVPAPAPAAPQPDAEQMEQAQRVLALPTWDDVMKLLTSDELRMYRIGIETDSTIVEMIQQDSQDMLAAIQAVVQVITEVGPLVEKQIMPLEAAKQLCLTVARNQRMGQAVEDALDTIKQPPPAQPEQDNSVQVAQINAQSAQAIAKLNNDTKTQVEAAKQQAQAQITAVERAADDRVRAAEMEADQRIAAMKAETDRAVTAAKEASLSEREAANSDAKDRREGDKALLDNATKIVVAAIAAKSTEAKAAEKAAEKTVEENI